MTRGANRLVLAVALSLLLHLLPFVSELVHQLPPRPAPPQPLRAELRPLAPTIPLEVPKPPAPSTPAKPPATKPRQPEKTSKTTVSSWLHEVRRQFQKQNEQGLFYPPEAIAQGLEGEALVFLIVDQQGRVMAARIEQSSGLRILDEAALKAVRSLHSLPADAPRESLLPVRFRLK